MEEKIFQRQLSKEGLQSIVDDKEQVNTLSTKDLRNLFKLRTGTPSDTHDKLRCERCQTVDDNADLEAMKVLPKQLEACKDLLEIMLAQEDASLFSSPLKPEEHGISSEQYDKVVKRPIDLGTIKVKLSTPVSQPNAYKNPSAFSKDVNRIFTNVVKCWEPGNDLADAARRLQSWWTEQWTSLVPRLMSMKPDDQKENENPDRNAGDEYDAELATTFIHNERGEDFQEQLGMPDEENMRHWSHHHTTDTVDDPVFRAAMRGFDNVSFVFGLEVTWSLIQQRQQEEEERQALLELETVQEFNDIDAKDPTSSCLDKVGNSTVIKEPKTPIEDLDAEEEDDDDETWNIAHIYTVDEISAESPALCECNNVACTLWKSDKGQESKVCPSCQEEEFGGWPEGMAPKNESNAQPMSIPNNPQDTRPEEDAPLKNKMPFPQSDETQEQCQNVAVYNNISSPLPQPTAHSKSRNIWSCQVCTFHNTPKAKKCKVCGSGRSPKKRKK